MTTIKRDFGLIGLGVMGRNFLLNVAEKGFAVAGFDVNPETIKELNTSHESTESVWATQDLQAFVHALKTPRKIMLLVPAGNPVDQALAELIPLLEPGDCIADGGNSYFQDTENRAQLLQKSELKYLGVGISGGAKGARFGPSIMPGGDRTAYDVFRPIFEASAAKFKGDPCVCYLGPGASGNYVKMVHNGIEYSLMELIAEIYAVLGRIGGYSNSEIGAFYNSCNSGRLQSYLIEISAAIFQMKDSVSKHDLLDVISDTAQQKGTGKWTSQNAMDLGIPIPAIDASVSQRGISSFKSLRQALSREYPISNPQEKVPQVKELCEPALFFGFLISFGQGMHLLTDASKSYQYGLNLADIARIWRAGCIIRSAVLEDIVQAFSIDSQLSHLLIDPKIGQQIRQTADAARELATIGLEHRIPTPALLAALNYFDAITTENLPSNLIQAQRDFFGSHTYRRTDREGIFHTQWED